MTIGILLIFAGILIAVYPPLLSIIVAAVLIVTGIVLVSISYRFKKMARRSDDPFVDLFFRY